METLVMNMATHVKFDAFRLKNAKDQVNTFLKKLDVTQDIFVELDFQVCGPKPNYVMCFKRPWRWKPIFFFKQPKCFILKH